MEQGTTQMQAQGPQRTRSRQTLSTVGIQATVSAANNRMSPVGFSYGFDSGSRDSGSVGGCQRG
jgi:hypothetical protein